MPRCFASCRGLGLGSPLLRKGVAGWSIGSVRRRPKTVTSSLPIAVHAQRVVATPCPSWMPHSVLQRHTLDAATCWPMRCARCPPCSTVRRSERNCCERNRGCSLAWCAQVRLWTCLRCGPCAVGFLASLHKCDKHAAPRPPAAWAAKCWNQDSRRRRSSHSTIPAAVLGAEEAEEERGSIHPSVPAALL